MDITLTLLPLIILCSYLLWNYKDLYACLLFVVSLITNIAYFMYFYTQNTFTSAPMEIYALSYSYKGFFSLIICFIIFLVLRKKK